MTGDYQSYGPTNDRRIKPDLQAPTDTETASRCGPDDALTGARECISPATPDHSMLRFGGTSGSTPFAGGAAALVRNWLRKFNTWEPGFTYAHMILYGSEVDPYSQRFGVGPFELPIFTVAHWGKVWLDLPADIIAVPTSGIPIQVGSSGWVKLAAAIWWPERPDERTDVDLYLIDPNNTQVAKGYHVSSVFERVEVDQPMVGTWRLKIVGHTLEQGHHQRVYWAAHLKGCDVLITPTDVPPVAP